MTYRLSAAQSPKALTNLNFRKVTAQAIKLYGLFSVLGLFSAVAVAQTLSVSAPVVNEMYYNLQNDYESTFRKFFFSGKVMRWQQNNSQSGEIQRMTYGVGSDRISFFGDDWSYTSSAFFTDASGRYGGSNVSTNAVITTPLGESRAQIESFSTNVSCKIEDEEAPIITSSSNPEGGPPGSISTTEAWTATFYWYSASHGVVGSRKETDYSIVTECGETPIRGDSCTMKTYFYPGGPVETENTIKGSGTITVKNSYAIVINGGVARALHKLNYTMSYYDTESPYAMFFDFAHRDIRHERRSIVVDGGAKDAVVVIPAPGDPPPGKFRHYEVSDITEDPASPKLPSGLPPPEEGEEEAFANVSPRWEPWYANPENLEAAATRLFNSRNNFLNNKVRAFAPSAEEVARRQAIFLAYPEVTPTCRAYYNALGARSDWLGACIKRLPLASLGVPSLLPQPSPSLAQK